MGKFHDISDDELKKEMKRRGLSTNTMNEKDKDFDRFLEEQTRRLKQWAKEVAERARKIW